jgi:5-enolpyruvylshikimate-3-phosphate synthase
MRGAARSVRWNSRDFSSAVFWMAAAARRGRGIEVEVGLNPTRPLGLLHARRAEVAVDDTARTARRAGNLPAGAGAPRGPPSACVSPAECALIDELPALAALATFGGRSR